MSTAYEYRHCQEIARQLPRELAGRCHTWAGCLAVVKELADHAERLQSIAFEEWEGAAADIQEGGSPGELHEIFHAALELPGPHQPEES